MKRLVSLSLLMAFFWASTAQAQRCPPDEDYCRDFCNGVPAFWPDGCPIPRCDCRNPRPDDPRDPGDPGDPPPPPPPEPVGGVQGPLTFTYSGFLRDVEGNPIEGAIPMAFSLYEASDGGVASWSEEHDAVPVEQGFVTIDLGQRNAIDPALLREPCALLGGSSRQW